MNDAEILSSAAKVLIAEGEALKTTAASLDAKVVKAVRILVDCKGRIIVSGMGKSGHIARKIAATMASTGTPAHFVHPGEASHGDLGMITSDDAVIAISNSGETAELSDLIHYTRRFSIPLIAITSRAASSLGEAADVTLQLPPVPEVCPMGLAPTTSTTMTLAMGDALAVAVLECKGITAEDFRNFHPGGKLGKTLLRVRDVMRKDNDMPVVDVATPMSQVMVIMTEKSLGCAGVVDAGDRLVGIITDGDLRRHMSEDLRSLLAEKVMTRFPITVAPTTLAAEALNILNEKKRTQLFVVEGGKPIGIVHIHDLLRAGIA